MDDLISRQELLKSIERISVKGNVLDDDWIYRFIQEFPSAQPERKTGRWIQTHRGERGFSRPGFRCDQCGEVNPRSSYCPSCGARMEESDR